MLLKSDSLVIRNAETTDASILGTWWRNGKIMAHAGFPNGLSITDEEIAESLSKDSDNTYRRLIIEADNLPVGEMNYRNIGNNTAEIGIKICDFSKQEKGYGSRLLIMLIDELFINCGYEKIVLDTNLNNKRAQHVYEKLGFIKVCERYDCWENQLGELQSAVDYEMKKDYYIRRFKEAEVKFYKINEIDESLLTFAVIVSRYMDKWVWCRNKIRNGWEIPGGRREKYDGTIIETANRELFEETGAIKFNLMPICVYSVRKEVESFGILFYADISEFGDLPENEIEKIDFFKESPAELSFPQIQPKLLNRVKDELKIV